MDEITLDDKTYVSSKRAAQITGYAKDYVGQLCREGRVEARLVGRNWYVLESSIREHRFGSDEKSPIQQTGAANSEPKEAWESTNYSLDTSPEPIPTLIFEDKSPKINQLEGRSPTFGTTEPVIKPESVPISSKVVTEMQSAWHDWFRSTNELEISKETLIEESNFEDNVESMAQKITDADFVGDSVEEQESTPVTLQKVSEVIESKEDVVPIHRSFSAPVVPIQRVQGVSQTQVQNRAATEYLRQIPSNAEQPLGRIIRERRVIRKRKPSTALKTILVLVAVIAIGIALIGTGEAGTFLTKYNLNFAPVNYLVGQSSFSK